MLNLGPVWGVDIGDSALKAVKLKRVGKNQVALLDFQIVRYADVAGEPGARREGLLPQALAALQAAGLGRERCIVSIAPQAVFSRFISLPPVDKRRIPEIVLYEARQQIPFNLNEVIWAYETVRKEFIPGEEIEIGLFAVKREVVDAYIGELAPLWKRLHGIQVGPLALYNFIRHELTVEQPTVVLDIGAQSTDLLIIEGSKFWLRNLPIAGNSFTSVLEKRLNIPRSEAEKLKLGVEESRHRRKLLEVLRPVMRDLVAEVQRSVGYYKSLSQAVKFEEILITGDGYRLFGLDRFLAEQLQYKITPVNQLKNVTYSGAQDRLQELEHNLPTLSVAMGLALQGLSQARTTINLLPDDFVIQRELHAKRFNGLVAAGLAWAIAGCFFMKENGTLSKMTELEGLGDSTLAQVERLQRDYEAARQGKDPARMERFEAYGKHREYYARVIGALATVIPREVQVDGFKFTEGPSATELPQSTRPMSAAATEEAAKVKDSTLRLSFQVVCDARLEMPYLMERLPNHLRQATIYGYKVPVIKGVLVGDPTLKATGAEATAVSTDAASAAALRKELTATVTIGLLNPQEADAALAEMKAKAAAEAAQQAEAARKASEAQADGTPAVGAEAAGPRS